MRQEESQEIYKEIIKKELPKKITSDFVRQYYGKMNQARLGLKDLEEFEDALIMGGLSGIDCRDIDFSELTKEEFAKFTFDSKTIFSQATIEQFNPMQILEEGKKFGLGLETIPLTGKGIHIAIRDENCNPYLTDCNIVDYTRIKDGNVSKKVNPEDIEHMHGKTTTSLLASKSCGVAKDAAVHFFSGSIDEYVQYIIDFNQKCKEEKRESEMILVASGSWRDRGFDKHSKELKEVGCELICANNFDINFNEFTKDNDKIEIPMAFSENEIEYLIERYPDAKDSIIAQAQRKDNVKIPISRTYHQVGENAGFKYQSAYSTSWGIPQVAGLFAVFKELNRNLTFEQFCEFANRTAEGELNIINPKGIYREIEMSLAKGKSGFEDCMQDDTVRTSALQEATKVVKETVIENEQILGDNEEQK